MDIAEFSLSDTGTGREALGIVFVLLLAISGVAIAIVAGRAAGALPNEGPVVLLSVGALAVLLVLYRIIDIPTDGHVPAHVDLSRKIGILIALIGAAAVTYGGWCASTKIPAGRAGPATADQPPAV